MFYSIILTLAYWCTLVYMAYASYMHELASLQTLEVSVRWQDLMLRSLQLQQSGKGCTYTLGNWYCFALKLFPLRLMLVGWGWSRVWSMTHLDYTHNIGPLHQTSITSQPINKSLHISASQYIIYAQMAFDWVDGIGQQHKSYRCEKWRQWLFSLFQPELRKASMQWEGRVKAQQTTIMLIKQP